MSARQLTPAVLAGRCANGYERGQGQVVHAVMCNEDELRFGIASYARALCGKTHGARSAGWSARKDQQVTCPKCLKAMPQLAQARRAELFEFIKHGDSAHQAWLLDAINAFFDGKPKPPPYVGSADDLSHVEEVSK